MTSKSTNHRRARVKQLVLHIGVHKTGTSTVQVGMREARPALREHGVAYIDRHQMRAMSDP
ncbi:MAG: hypothetical protein QGG40_03295, partial [Myxococcota bacterium]|nr:hypothetical protein [Myxococcota bacterium]